MTLPESQQRIEPELSAVRIMRHTVPARRYFEKRLREELNNLIACADETIELLLNRAYAEGVQDGFRQGVRTAAKTGTEERPRQTLELGDDDPVM